MPDPAAHQVRRLPTVVAWAMRPLPLTPLEMALGRLLSGILARHPDLVGRLEGIGRQRVAVAPTDLPFVILFDIGNGTMALRLARTMADGEAEARIAGPLLALVGLVDGVYDGDALFFSRDLVIEGDMETVLALRNAIDDADVALADEIAAALGPLGGPFRLAHGAAAGLVAALARGGAERRAGT